MQRKKCSKEGISLVEVVVALLIFSMCVAGMCWLITMGRRGSDNARGHYTAINIGKNRLERVKTFDFDQMELFAQDNVEIDRSGVADAEGDYRITTTISTVTNDLKEVVVTVDIKDRISRAFEGESETVSTYIADFVEYAEE